jgi:protein associated with RNAse G/E
VTTVLFHWRKYNGREHWLHRTEHLGTDEHGEWFVQRQGEVSSRPGMSYTTETTLVILLPPSGTWVARIFPSGRDDHMKLYIDLAHEVIYHREEAKVTAVDMDLDVIQMDDGYLYLEDEDEFREHAVAMHYPQALVAQTKHEASKLLTAVAEETEPFGSVAEYWLAKAAK